MKWPDYADNYVPIVVFTYRRHHQIPAHKRERGGVAELHAVAFYLNGMYSSNRGGDKNLAVQNLTAESSERGEGYFHPAQSRASSVAEDE